MKKILLLLFLIASFTVVSAKTHRASNSLSPPVQSLDAISDNAAATIMLQTPIAQPIQIDVGLFENHVSCFSLFENYQSVMPDTDVGCNPSFQVLANSNSVRMLSGKSDCLLQAVSPNCRAVSQDFLQSDVALKLVGKTQAVSPNCRDVLSVS